MNLFRRFHESIALFLGAVVLGTTLVVIVAMGTATQADASADLTTSSATRAAVQRTAPFWVTRPCQYEDSVNCYWNAGTSGNGGGHSFVVRKLRGGLTCVFYVERAYAKKHDNCSRFEVKQPSTTTRYRFNLRLR